MKALLNFTQRIIQPKALLSNCFCHHLRASTTTSIRYQSHLVPLTNRKLINVYGKDSCKLLQGLVTNDINLIVEKQNYILYTMLLNVQGRVDHDLLVYRDSKKSDSYLIECDYTKADELIALMKRYKLRSKVKFSAIDDLAIHCLFHDITDNIDVSSNESHPSLFKDPRLSQMGYRVLIDNMQSTDEILSSHNAKVSSLDHYINHRYKLGIAEGSTEVSNFIPLELNLALLNGVSFTKGCYIGQELVARAHHTGVIRKRCMSLKFSTEHVIHGDKILNSKNKNVGKIIGCNGPNGIGLMRLREVLKENQTFKTNENIEVEITKPDWWPTDLQIN